MSHNEQDFAARIRETGHRLTPQRQLILDSLCDIGDHATIQQLYNAVHAKAPAIDKATIYRSLHFFEQLKLVVSAEIDNTIVYEIAHPEPHHHLVCTACGDVSDIDGEHFASLNQALFETYGFKAQFDHLTIDGLCANCNAASD